MNTFEYTSRTLACLGQGHHSLCEAIDTVNI